MSDHVTNEARELGSRMADAQRVTPDLMREIVARCRRLSLNAGHAKVKWLQQKIEAHAWTDAALALIEMELPQWQLRRLSYDEGEWRCALSRQRELPEWLDGSIEGHHADLALAILSAVVEVWGHAAGARRTSVPTVPQHEGFEPVLCDNFG